MNIIIDDLSGADIKTLLLEHLQAMNEVSPPESVHALNIGRLCQPNITFWSIWSGATLAGCGALKELNAEHGEIKSMRTASAYLRQGIAARMLQHIIKEAKQRNYRRLSLETGSMDYFKPAHKLYSRFGFKCGEPFADYIEDPNSVFMTIDMMKSHPLTLVGGCSV